MSQKQKIKGQGEVEARNVPDNKDELQPNSEGDRENVSRKEGKASEKSKLRALHDALQDPVSTCDG